MNIIETTIQEDIDLNNVYQEYCTKLIDLKANHFQMVYILVDIYGFDKELSNLEKKASDLRQTAYDLLEPYENGISNYTGLEKKASDLRQAAYDPSEPYENDISNYTDLEDEAYILKKKASIISEFAFALRQNAVSLSG